MRPMRIEQRLRAMTPDGGSEEAAQGIWTVKQLPGFRINPAIVVTAPGCPDGPHPTRHCGCRVFRLRRAAQTYADQKNRRQETSNGTPS